MRCFNRVNERYDYVKTAGEIKILGKNIYDPDVSLIELRKAVGMVFQRPNPLPISVYENVVFGLRIHGERRDLKRALLDAAVERPSPKSAYGRTSRTGSPPKPPPSSSNNSRSSASPGSCRSSRASS